MTTMTTAPHPRLAAYRRRVSHLHWEIRWAKERIANMQQMNTTQAACGLRKHFYLPDAIEHEWATIATIQAEITQLQGWIDTLA